MRPVLKDPKEYTHKYSKHPEFTNLEKHVWEGLNNMGRTIPHLQEGGEMPKRAYSKKAADKPIWHSKTELDRFVAGQLNVKMEDYGVDKSKNPLFKAIAAEIGRLRRAGVLIDLHTIKSRNTGMGVWRLDKTKLDRHLYRKARQEMRSSNFRSTEELCLVFARQKQNAFRLELFEEYRKCALCGFGIAEYMIGAHIVPYSVMRTEDPDNSMNPRNGLLLCRFCDVAFERGSIRVRPDLGIDISDRLRDERSDIVRSWLGPIPAELRIKSDAKYPPDSKYLKWKIELLCGATSGGRGRDVPV